MVNAIIGLLSTQCVHNCASIDGEFDSIYKAKAAAVDDEKSIVV